MTQVAHEYVDIPLLVVGGFNAAPPSDDRGMDTLPYDKGNAALTNVLTRLSLTDIHRHKFPPSTHYTWSNSSGRKSRIGAVYANTKALDMAGGVNDFFSSIGKTPGKLGTDHSPLFSRFHFHSPVATPYNGSLPAVFSPLSAAPARWGLDGRGAESYHDLLLQWSQHEHLSELSLGRTAFQRTVIYLLAYTASVLELVHPQNESQVRAAAARASRSPRYTTAHVVEQTSIIVAHIQTLDPPIFDARKCIQQCETASTIWPYGTPTVG
jgi:hypothetical protein